MMRMAWILAVVVCPTAVWADTLPGTEPLAPGPDWAKVMLEGIERSLDRAIAKSVAGRDAFYSADSSNAEAYTRSLEPNRQRFRKLIGLVDEPARVIGFEYVGTNERMAPLAVTEHFKAFAVRWPALSGVTGEGLLLVPNGPARANVVAIPDADQSPEQIAGLAPGLSVEQQFARRLAENGCRVIVPVLIDRKDTWSNNPRISRTTNQTHREFVWRMAYQMGRHILGYEVQRILAATEGLAAEAPRLPLGVYGYGEGGLLALYAAAVHPRIDATVVSGYFGPRERLDQEPIYRDVWNLYREFGDAELLRLVVPRALFIESATLKPQPAPGVQQGRAGAAPGMPLQPTADQSRAEMERGLARIPAGLARAPIEHIVPAKAADSDHAGLGAAVPRFLAHLLRDSTALRASGPSLPAVTVDFVARQKRQFDELVTFTQKLMPEAVAKRQANVWAKLDVKNLEDFKKSQEKLREQFWQETIGKLPEPVKNPRPRTRQILETPKWKGYEVVLDVEQDVISYGILLVPNGIKPGERRPTVVCQHGLEGRPMDVVDPKIRTKYYNSFGAQLADAGYVVFAPQNPYIFKTQFRQAVRKMHPLGLSLYAFIVRQHEVILNFLETLPFVDATRIAYYGLSYGGKVAVRIPAVLTRYAVSICSGDFNEWIWKNITLDWGGSYMFTGEYEMFEFNLGNTFNYAEMVALIAPRPFMVERGHDDGVGLDEYVSFEFAKARRLYARLGIADRCEIEYFLGGHEIHGQGTFAFLRKHLRWPGTTP